MAYDPKAEYAGHLKRIARDLFVFRGRSQRTELFLYIFVVMMITIVVTQITGIPKFYVDLAVAFPLIPLLARRLHDFNRSGWFALIAPVIVGLHTWAWRQFEAGILLMPEPEYPYNVLKGVLVLLLFIMLFWPGTKGANRFGPDPRLDDALAAN